MRVLLLLLGCLVLGAVLVEAHRDRAESDIEAKNEGVQGDFVKEREIRSTGGKKKKNRPSLKSTAGVFSALSRPTKTLSKRSIAESPSDQKRRKKCPGCYTSLLVRQPQILAAAPVKRKQRDSEVHEKIRKKNRRLKDKSKSKRRRNKEHKERERHAIIQTEYPEIGENNNKRHKNHHRGRKDKGHHHAGGLSSISSILPEMKTQTDIGHTETEYPEIGENNNKRHKNHHRGRKDKGHHHAGGLSSISSILPEMKTQTDIGHTEDITN